MSDELLLLLSLLINLLSLAYAIYKDIKNDKK